MAQASSRRQGSSARWRAAWSSSNLRAAPGDRVTYDLAMTPKVWSPMEISDAVAGSGKPLEVTAAQAFLRANWTANLGTYFDEQNTLKPPRELDVFATREKSVAGQADT